MAKSLQPYHIGIETKPASIPCPSLALADRFDDTMAVLGSDALRAALDIYAQLPKAADRNIPGANSAVEILKPFFEKAKQKPAAPTDN